MTTPRTIKLQREPYWTSQRLPDWSNPLYGCRLSYAACDNGLLRRRTRVDSIGLQSSEKIYELWCWEDIQFGRGVWMEVHLEVVANKHLDDIPSQQKDPCVMDEIRKLRNEIQRNNAPRKWITLIVDDVLPVLCGAIAGALIAILWSI